MTKPKNSLKNQPHEGRAGIVLTWIRDFFTHNLPLKLLSLLLAITVWGIVAPQRRGGATEIKFFTPLVLKNIPVKVAVTNNPTELVNVLVRVPRSLARSINPNLFQVNVDLSSQITGAFEYTLSEHNISYNNLPMPAGVEVLQISPQTIEFVLEELGEREVPLQSRFSGETARGFTLESATLVPHQVKVVGPKSLLEKLKYIPIRPLDIQDLKNNVEMAVQLEMPLHVRLADKDNSFFRAVIKVSATPNRALLRDIPVVFDNAEYIYQASTQKVNVYVEGPKALIAQLNSKNLTEEVNMAQYPPGDHRGIMPKVILPAEIRVLEQWPIVDLFVTSRKISEAQVPEPPTPAPVPTKGR